MRSAPDERWRVKAASLRLLVGAPLAKAQRRLVSQFVDVYLRLRGADEQAFQAEVATFATPEREAVMEIVTSWELKGQVEGQRQLVEFQLTRKLGELPEAALAHLHTLSTSQLTTLGGALLDFSSLVDLEQWLSRLTLHQEAR